MFGLNGGNVKEKIKRLEREARRLREKARGQDRLALCFQFAYDPEPVEPGEEVFRFDFGGLDPGKEP